MDDGLAFDRTAGIKIRIDGWATQLAGGYSPSECVESIQKILNLWLRVLLIYQWKPVRFFYIETITRDAFSAVRIIRYSAIFSAVMMPTNCPLWVTGSAGTPDS
jgi:hypothetical protein